MPSTEHAKEAFETNPEPDKSCNFGALQAQDACGGSQYRCARLASSEARPQLKGRKGSPPRKRAGPRIARQGHSTQLSELYFFAWHRAYYAHCNSVSPIGDPIAASAEASVHATALGVQLLLTSPHEDKQRESARLLRLRTCATCRLERELPLNPLEQEMPLPSDPLATPS